MTGFWITLLGRRSLSYRNHIDHTEAFDRIYKFSEFHLQVIHNSKDVVKNVLCFIAKTHHDVTTFNVNEMM